MSSYERNGIEADILASRNYTSVAQMLRIGIDASD